MVIAKHRRAKKVKMLTSYFINVHFRFEYVIFFILLFVFSRKNDRHICVLSSYPPLSME